MMTSERKALILDLLNSGGRVVAKEAASQLGVSEDTVRRDLRELAADGLLQRVHGGALPLTAELPDFTTRKSIGTAEKRRLGKYAAQLVAPGMNVFIDGGTTNEMLAAALPKDVPITVATHSPTIASLLEKHSAVEVILVGGRLFKHSMVAVGALAASAILRLRPDIFFMGATGVASSAGYTTGDLEEAEIKRLIAGQSERTYVLATASKLGIVSPAAIIPASAATLIISDEAAEAPIAELRESGMAVTRITDRSSPTVD